MNPYEVNYPGKNSTGPFANDTEAKLSILFSIATVLAHGVPTFPLLLDYKNQKTARTLESMELIADVSVPRLCCTIELDFQDGQTLTDSLSRSAQDYSFSCEEVSRLARAVGSETGVPAKAYDLLDEFVRGLPARGSIQQVVESFSMMP